MNIDKLLSDIKETPILQPNMIAKVAVLYSHSQKCFHIESLMEYVIENLTLSVTGKKGDYRLVGIADNDEAAHNLIEEIRAWFSFLGHDK